VLAHEAGLTQALFSWRPDCMQTVLSADLKRGWLLMPDESPRLRDPISLTDGFTHWEPILRICAGVQRDLVSRCSELLELGILDRHLTGLPEQYERLLGADDVLLLGQPDGLTMEQYNKLVDLIPTFSDMCSRLAAYGIPETLHHDDLHDGNVFIPGGRYVFSDWGESCVTHPFFTLLVTLRSIAYRFDLPYGAREHNFIQAAEILRLQDFYLSEWTDFGTLEELREIADMACRVGMVNRALTWNRVTTHLGGEDRKRYAASVPGWLQEFLDVMTR
jgi:hypothetical protein